MKKLDPLHALWEGSGVILDILTYCFDFSYTLETAWKWG